MSRLVDSKKNVPLNVVDAISNMSWEKLDELSDGSLLFPATIQKRKSGGEWESVPVRLRVPRESDMRKARVQARSLALKDGLDLDRDEDLVSNLENICLLSECVRSVGSDEPFDPFPEHFEKHYDRDSIAALYELLDRYSELLNPRPDTISQDEILFMIARIAEVRNIVPLAAYGPGAVNSCIVGMADLCKTFLESKSSLESQEPSMQE